MLPDLKLWKKFLSLPSAYCRPFMDFSRTFSATELDFYSDASKNMDLGFGAYCALSWMQAKWKDLGISQDIEPSIQYLELYALTTAVLAWISRFQNKTVIIFCDNNSVVSMVNHTTSSCKNCMVLIRFLVLHCLKFNVKLNAKHVTSKANGIANSLSRLQWSRFAALTADRAMDAVQTQVLDEIRNISDIWLS